jgi:integrase
MRARGTGGLVKLRYRDKKTDAMVESRYWYLFFYHNGRRIRESSETESKMEAEKLLQRRMGEVGLGITPEQDVKHLRYEQMRDAMMTDFKNRDCGSLYTRKDGVTTIAGLEHLDSYFKNMRVTAITTDTLRAYIAHQKGKGYSDPSVRKQLVILRSMMNMARKDGKLRLVDIPHFPMPKDSAPRQGFVEPAKFRELLAALPINLRPLIQFVYYTGCRLGAAQQITWSMVNKDCTEISLPGNIIKTGEPLLLPLTGGLSDVSKTLKKMFRKEGPVFNSTNLRKCWNTACNQTGLGVYDKKTGLYTGLMIHDLRRSAVRNLVRAGVSRKVAMAISGHKTEAIFERYNIINTRDLHDAMEAVGKYAARQ